MSLFDLRKPKQPSFQLSWQSAGLIGVIGLLLILMFVLAKAPQGASRLEALQTKSDEFQRLAQTRGDLSVFPAGSVCRGTLSKAFRDQLTQQIASTGLNIVSLDLNETGLTDTKTPLVTNSVSLQAEGSYEGAVSALSVLSSLRPMVFIDSLSLKNRVDRVEIHIEGRVFCR